MREVAARLGGHPEQTERRGGRPPEEPERGCEGELEDADRQRHPERDALRTPDRVGLRDELAEHDMQEGDQCKGDRDRRVLDDARRNDAERGEQGLEQVLERGLPDPAEAEAGERHAELGGG